MDEVAHIPAGYSYLSQRDMRLNPEHPPLLKDLSAIPLLFAKGINFPSQLNSWKDEVNSQWDFGFNFLYNFGNDADKIIFWSRLPMLLLLIALGFFIYRWTKELYGRITALLATFLFAFSPTFIAHGRYVTTDVGAAAGFFIATYFFVKWLTSNKTSSLILAGVFFGLAQMIKFSLFLLVPYFSLLLLIWIYIKWRQRNKFIKTFISYCLKFILILIIGYILVYPVYLFHTSNYPYEKQISDTNFIVSQFPFKPAEKLVNWMINKPILKPYAHYMLGLFMVFQRATGGNTTYFLGEVTNKGWYSYFPIVYAIKPPLVLHISNLNIGVRHILPTFPFVYILISGQVKRIFEYVKNKKLYIVYCILLTILLLWYTFSSLSIFPFYLTHFNELAGGAKNGYIYVTDSNLDWGQDLKRLAKWVDEQDIEKIKVDYFGGATVEYYLGDKYEEWHGDWNPADLKGSWLALSATFKQQGQAKATKGFDKPTDYYMWLNQYQPVTVIGNSIFVYYIE